MGESLIQIFYFLISIYGGIRAYRFNRDRDYSYPAGRLVPIKSKEFIIILINFLIIGIHGILIFTNSLTDKLNIMGIFSETLILYLWFWIFIEYMKYKRNNEKKYFISVIVSFLIVGAIFGYVNGNLAQDVMYTEINSIPEKDIYLYRYNEEEEEHEIYNEGFLKYQDNKYTYSWVNEEDQKENPPTLEIKDVDNDGDEELFITFNNKSHDGDDKLYSTIDLDTGERTDRYDSDLYLEIEGKPVALSGGIIDKYKIESNEELNNIENIYLDKYSEIEGDSLDSNEDNNYEIRIESKEDLKNIEGIYLDEIKEYEYFLIKNKNQEDTPNYLIRAEYGRVNNMLKLSNNGEYKDYKLSLNEVYMAVNFIMEDEKGLTTNSIDIVKLNNRAVGRMKKEKIIGEFKYSIDDYKFEDNFKFIITKSKNNEVEEFKLNPTNAQIYE